MGVNEEALQTRKEMAATARDCGGDEHQETESVLPVHHVSYECICSTVLDSTASWFCVDDLHRSAKLIVVSL